MASYTLATDALDEAALTRYVQEDVNVGRAAEGLPPYANNNAFIQDRFREIFAPVVAIFNAADAQVVLEAYMRARDLTLRARIKADLGVDGDEGSRG